MNPCTGHHPPGTNPMGDVNLKNDNDRFDFCYRIRLWEQCQLSSYISSIKKLNQTGIYEPQDITQDPADREAHGPKSCRDCSILEFYGTELGDTHRPAAEGQICPSSKLAPGASARLLKHLSGAHAGHPGRFLKRRSSFSEGCHSKVTACGTDEGLRKSRVRTVERWLQIHHILTKRGSRSCIELVAQGTSSSQGVPLQVVRISMVKTFKEDVLFISRR